MERIVFEKKEAVWVAELKGVQGSINIDIERKAPGRVVIAQKNPSATRYKGGQIVRDSEKLADMNFNLINDASMASIDVKITSLSEVENAYYE